MLKMNYGEVKMKNINIKSCNFKALFNFENSMIDVEQLNISEFEGNAINGYHSTLEVNDSIFRNASINNSYGAAILLKDSGCNIKSSVFEYLNASSGAAIYSSKILNMHSPISL